MTSVHELIRKLSPFSDATLPEAIARQVLDLAKESIPKISLDDFGDFHPDLRQICFTFDHMVRLGYFAVYTHPVADDDDDHYYLDGGINHVGDFLSDRMKHCTHLTHMRGKDILAFFTDELLQFFETNSILLTCGGVPLTENQVIPIAYNTDT